jgi:hypothetical protein
MRIYYKCHPIRDLRVIPAANIITRACLAPCFFYGMSRYHTIPSKFSHYEVLHFAGGGGRQGSVLRQREQAV